MHTQDSLRQNPLSSHEETHSAFLLLLYLCWSLGLLVPAHLSQAQPECPLIFPRGLTFNINYRTYGLITLGKSKTNPNLPNASNHDPRLLLTDPGMNMTDKGTEELVSQVNKQLIFEDLV